jgi:hypothetical protein
LVFAEVIKAATHNDSSKPAGLLTSTVVPAADFFILQTAQSWMRLGEDLCLEGIILLMDAAGIILKREIEDIPGRWLDVAEHWSTGSPASLSESKRDKGHKGQGLLSRARSA